jgi:hypothetical protein
MSLKLREKQQNKYTFHQGATAFCAPFKKYLIDIQVLKWLEN